MTTTVNLIVAILLLFGYVQSVNNAAAAQYANEFGLSDVTIALTFGWISLGFLGALAVGRAMDRLGRRKVLMTAVGGLSVTSAAVALAPDLVSFAVAQVLAVMCSGSILTVCTVIISEELDAESRAKGQGLGGIAVQVGGGLSMIIVALAANAGGWRLAWTLPAVGALAALFASRGIRETQLFDAAASGVAERPGFRELLGPGYRHLTVPVLIAYALVNVTTFSTMTWVLYFPQTQMGLSATVVTTLVIVGGAFGLVGFPLGATLSNRIGRRPTVVIGALVLWTANTAYYWVPPGPELRVSFSLGALLAVGSIGAGMSSVAFRTTATELLPTRLRGTLQGALVAVAAVAVVLTQIATAALTAHLGELRLAISVLAASIVPGAALFFWCLPETMGRELHELDEVAAKSE